MADTDIVQVIAEARADAKSLSEFVFKPAGFIVSRRLAPSINTLQFYINSLDSLKSSGENYISTVPSLIAEAIASAGYSVVGSFDLGATVTARNQVMIDANGNSYRWTGDLPKTVPASSTPASTGGTGSSAWMLVSDTTQAVDIELLKKRGVNYHYTQMGKAFDSKDGVNDPFASWPHENIDYDNSTDKFVIFYNTNSGHSISQCSVLMRTKSPESESFSEPSIVASDKGNFSYKTQGSGIAKNGDYLSLVARFPWNSNISNATFVYRSTDKGVTFTRAEMTHGGAAITAFNGDVSGFLVTQSGRILTFGNHPTTRLCRIYYSDDNGVTWNLASIAGSPTDVSEPAWCDIGGGKLVCMARASIVAGSNAETIPAKFMTSIDNGSTWTAPVDSKSITNLTLSNGTLIPDYEKKTVEFIHHSRRTDSDGYSSILRSWATLDEAFSDNFKPQVRVGKLAAYVKLDDVQGDSGYMGAAKSKNGVINAFYYSGKRTNAQINWLVGLPNTTYNSNKEFDYRTGELGSNNRDMAASPRFDVYRYGQYNHALPLLPIPRAPTQGEIRGGYMRLMQTAVADKTQSQVSRIFFHKPIEMDNIDYVGVNVSDMTVALKDYSVGLDSLDVSVAIYAGNTPETQLYARRIVSEKGVIAVNTRDLTGAAYIAIALGSRHPTASFADIDSVFIGGAGINKPFTPYNENTIWQDGARLLGVSGFKHVPIDSDEVGTIDTTGNIIKLNASSITKATSTHYFINKVAIPSGAKYITCQVQNKNSSILTDPNFVYVGVIDTLSPANSVTGVLIQEANRDTKGWAVKIVPIPAGAANGNTYFFMKVVGGKGAGIESYIKDISIHF